MPGRAFLSKDNTSGRLGPWEGTTVWLALKPCPPLPSLRHDFIFHSSLTFLSSSTAPQNKISPPQPIIHFHSQDHLWFTSHINNITGKSSPLASFKLTAFAGLPFPASSFCQVWRLEVASVRNLWLFPRERVASRTISRSSAARRLSLQLV